jgi:hypothetical protein
MVQSYLSKISKAASIAQLNYSTAARGVKMWPKLKIHRSLSALEQIHSSTWCTYFVRVCLRRHWDVCHAALGARDRTADLFTAERVRRAGERKWSWLICRREKTSSEHYFFALISRLEREEVARLNIYRKTSDMDGDAPDGGLGRDFVAAEHVFFHYTPLDAGHARFFLLHSLVGREGKKRKQLKDDSAI